MMRLIKITQILVLQLFMMQLHAIGKTVNLSDTTRYNTQSGYGYDILPSPSKKSNQPFYYSFRLPDGNYSITVRLGSKMKAGITTVRAESRRLFVSGQQTQKGDFVEESFKLNWSPFIENEKPDGN